MTSSKRSQGVAQLAWDHASWIRGLSSLDFPIPLPLGPNLLIQQGFFFFFNKKEKKKKKRGRYHLKIVSLVCCIIEYVACLVVQVHFNGRPSFVLKR